MFKQIALATIAAITTTMPALANNINQHNQLLTAVNSTGITTRINPAECDVEPGAFGWYSARNAELVICQENKIKGSSRQVEWTAEDFDTVRHEAHHVAQDCRDNSLNGRLNSVYKDPVGLAADVLNEKFIDGIIESYGSRGKHIVIMELEAFSVAAINDPIEQVQDIKRYCF